MLTELARRWGAALLTECRELTEAFLSKVGVPVREGGAFVGEMPFREFRA